MHLIASHSNEKIATRLWQLPQFLNGKYFVAFDDSETSKYYVVQDGKFARCPVLQEKWASHAQAEVVPNDDKRVEAYVTFDKQGYTIKMLADDKKQVKSIRKYGTVCVSTSSIKKEHVVKISQELTQGVNVIESKKPNKLLLCDVYEVLMRHHKPDMILRPFHVYLVKKLDSAAAAKPGRKPAKK
jgi:hypothetical protein